MEDEKRTQESNKRQIADSLESGERCLSSATNDKPIRAAVVSAPVEVIRVPAAPLIAVSFDPGPFVLHTVFGQYSSTTCIFSAAPDNSESRVT